MIDLRKLDAALATKVFGMNLAAFGIFSVPGSMRLRDRDFESVEEAQRYIDSEDERLPAGQQSRGKVQILPCVRAHPAYSSDTIASKALRAKLGERWDWILSGESNESPADLPYTFVLGEKGFTNDDYIAAAEAETEELAVALCAAKPYGIEVSNA